MAGEKPNPTIFISYAWANSDVADEIDKYFSSVGMSLTRDVRDAKYRESIKEFMKKIGKCDFVLMLISKEFLESPNCMYEAMEMFSYKDFKKRFLPIVLENANFYSPNKRIEYITYWESKYEELNNKIKGIKNLNNIDESLREDLKIKKDISENIGNILGKIKDMNARTYEHHKNNNFKDLLEIIGFENGKLLEELFQIVFLDEDDKKLINLDKFLLRHPNYRAGLFYKAYLYGEIKEYDTAIMLWDNYINLYKDDHAAWGNKGNAYADSGKHEKAFECYDKSIEIKLDFHEAWNNKGVVFADLGQYEKAIECYDKSIEIKPDKYEAWNNKGIAYDDLGQYDKAIVCYNKAIEIKPDKNEAWNNKGNAYAALGQYDKAFVSFYKALEIKPDKHEAWFNLACAHALMNNKLEMLKKIGRASCRESV